jgi:UDP-4-amino-4,6-dideoxy-N-acetyl-beta-L-altrosamine N-acetyltransferase
MLRPLEESDLQLILSWRNAPTVRQEMYSQHEISLEEHITWFQRMQADSSRRWYLYLDRSLVPLGVVYFTGLNQTSGNVFWGFYTKPEATPGTGIRISLEALHEAFDELGLHKLNAEVFSSNQRSLDMHKKVGFQEEGRFREQFFNGNEHIDVIRLGMLASEWPNSRQALQARIEKLDEPAAQYHHASAGGGAHRIVILSDANSWINSTVDDLVTDWSEQGHQVAWHHELTDVQDGDFLFCLSFGQLVPASMRCKFLHALVVHESDLPQGKGWSPLTWQILEGQNRIPVTLFEAAEDVDSGPIYAQRWLEFEGHELIVELREGQAKATVELCRWFVDDYPNSASERTQQQGKESFYARRRPQDSELDPNKSLAEQFNLLKVVDNERYPAFFYWKGRRYQLNIFPEVPRR